MFRLFAYTTGRTFGVGLETDDGVFDYTHALEIYQKAKGVATPISANFLQVISEFGFCSGPFIRGVLAESWVKSKLSGLTLKPNYRFETPIARPSKIIAMGRNYHAHIKELKHETPKAPLFFCKSPSAMISHESEIVIPNWLDTRVDHEAELGVVIGKQAKNVTQEEAMSCVAGYTIINDVTARDMQKGDIAAGDPWFRSKSIDTFCPVGPYLVPVEEIPDPHALNIKLTVNGEVRQNANTSAMIFKIPEIIAEISRYLTLEAGDLIATGTPEGVSPIKAGDEIEVSIEGLGTLKNTVVRG
jgi:5-oxopent-3-ene-1,2,5-tricarboxylate decarboxylase / 2-hydroxyhepta-2,4-diene-1,7-dioate isomerase